MSWTTDWADEEMAMMGYRRINGVWVSDEVLFDQNFLRNNPLLGVSTQSSDHTHYSAYPGTPQMKSEPLPKCSTCNGEVKPGEDQCWGCLGEFPELDYGIFEYTATGNVMVSSVTFSTTTQTTQTFTFPPVNMIAGDTIQFTWKLDSGTLSLANSGSYYAVAPFPAPVSIISVA